jgi:hypothetical protein
VGGLLLNVAAFDYFTGGRLPETWSAQLEPNRVPASPDAGDASGESK